MLLTSVGVPSALYATVRDLRRARGARLGALQRKFPALGIILLCARTARTAPVRRGYLGGRTAPVRRGCLGGRPVLGWFPGGARSPLATLPVSFAACRLPTSSTKLS